MPPGDLVVADYQWELRAVLMGVTTRFKPAPPGIKGLVASSVKSADVDLEGADGSYASVDRKAPRVITIPMTILEINAGTAMNSLQTLSAAWDASATDIPLYIRLPGWGKFHVNGRPRGLVEDLTD